jgi:hypothetical protein
MEGGVVEESRGSQIMFKFIPEKMDYLKNKVPPVNNY